MKIIPITAFIIFLINSLLFAQEIDKKKNYIITGEQIIRQQWHLASLQTEVIKLTYAFNEK